MKMASAPGGNNNKVNWIGLGALYGREVRRFWKIFPQTILSPAVTSLLFIVVFKFAFEGQGRSAGDIPFAEFLVPGLILMAVMNNASMNAASSLMMAKAMNYLPDTLLPPLSPGEVVLGYVLGSATRGLIAGIAAAGALIFVAPINIHSPALILFHLAAVACLFSLVGLMTAIWADKMDHAQSVNNFVLAPLTFLSGTFYSIEHLPGAIQSVVRFNPIFYAIDGFRYGFLGHADAPLWLGFLIMVTLNAAAAFACHRMIKTGWRLRS